MAALLPTPSSDWDPGSRQETWPTATAHLLQQDLLSNFTLDHRKGQLKERAMIGCLSCFLPLFCMPFCL